jgi:hypothetical protein
LGAYETTSFTGIVPDAGGIVYVKETATGTGDGSSWTNAYAGLSDPLAAAKTMTCIKEIWVYAGTYKPARRADTQSNASATDRDNAFVLVEGVKIYGGFSNTITTLPAYGSADRNGVSILSGDINTVNTNDAYHVVVGAGTLTAATVLDGFTVSGGNSTGGSASYITVNGGNVFLTDGAGISLRDNASPALTNLVISGNTASRYGGGVYTLSNSSPTLASVQITGNTAGSDGGGVCNGGSSPTLTDVTLTGNTSGNNGGGIYNYNSSPKLTNVKITGNTAGSGGGVYNSISMPVLTNVTVSGNYAATNCGGIYFSGSTADQVRNSIIYGNTSGGISQNVNSTVAAIYSYALVEDAATTDATHIISNADPLFANSDYAVDLTPKTGGDYSLQALSPAIDRGLNSHFMNATNITTDLAGNTRIQGCAIDLGAYETENVKTMLSVAGAAIAAKTYDKTTDATVTGASFTNSLTNDAVTGLTLGMDYTATGVFSNENAGTGKTVTVTVRLTAAGKLTYHLCDSVFTLTGQSIAKRDITVTSKVQPDVIYGTPITPADSIPPPGQLYGSDRFTGTLIIDGAVSTSGNPVAGGHNILLGTLAIDDGNSGNNYNLTFIPRSFNVLKKMLGHNVTVAPTKEYDGTTAAAHTGGLTGLISGDDAALHASFALYYYGPQIQTAGTIWATGWTLTGVDKDNYNLPTFTAQTADITPRNLTLHATTNPDHAAHQTQNITYGDDVSIDMSHHADASTPLLTGHALSGLLTLKNALPKSGAGFYKAGRYGFDHAAIKVMDGSSTDVTANYSITMSRDSVIIAKRALTVVDFTVADRVYDGTVNAAFSGTPALATVLPSDAVTLTAGTPAFTDKNAGNSKPVTLAFSISGADAGNYYLTNATPAGVTANIAQRPVTVTGIAATDRDYDCTTDVAVTGAPALTHTGNSAVSGVVSPDNVSILNGLITGSVADRNADEDKPVTLSLTLSGTDAGNYEFVQPLPALTVDISPIPVTVLEEAADKIYDGTAVAALKPGFPKMSGVLICDTVPGNVLVALDGSAVSYAFDTPDACNGSTIISKPVTRTGVYTLTGSAAGNYTLTQQQSPTTLPLPACIIRKIVEVTFPVVPGTFTYHPDSTLQDRSDLECLGRIEITNGYDGPGGVLCNPLSPGHFEWVERDSVPQAGTHYYDVRFVPADDNNYVYQKVGGGDLTDDDFIGSIPLTVLKAQLPFKNTFAFPTAEEITYSPCRLLTNEYLNNNGEPASPNIYGHFEWGVDTTSTIPPAGTNSYPVNFVANDLLNYDYSGLPLQQNVTLKVKKATPAVTWMDTVYVTYGEFMHQGTWLPTNRISELQVGAEDAECGDAYPVPGSFVFPDTPDDVRNMQPAVSQSCMYPMWFIPSGGYVNNYNTVPAQVYVKVSKAVPSVTFPQAELTYGDKLSAATLTGATPSVPGTFVFETPDTYPRVSDSQTTKYPLLFIPDDADNYQTVRYPDMTVTVLRRPLAIAAIDTEKVYGAVDPPLPYEIVSGNLADWVQGDRLTGNLARAAGNNTGTYYPITRGTLKVVDYPFNADITDNYDIIFTGADFTVTPKPLTVKPHEGQSKVYGEADPACYSYDIIEGGFVGSDGFAGTCINVRDAGENVGRYIIRKGSLSISDGNGGNNYTLTVIDTVTFRISKKPLVITVTDQPDVVYGTAVTPAYTYNPQPLAWNDVFAGALAVTGGGTSSSGFLTAGEYATARGTLTVEDGASADVSGNYDISFTGDAFKVTQKPLAHNLHADDREYDGTDAATFTDGLTGAIPADDVWLQYPDLYFTAGKNVQTDGQVEARVWELEGSDAGNYDLPPLTGLTASITPRPLTVTVTPQPDVEYGTAVTPDYSITSGSLATGDALTGAPAITGGVGSSGRLTAGEHHITQGSLTIRDDNGAGDDMSGNYDLTFEEADFEVTKLPLAITVTDQPDIEYGTAVTPAYSITSGSLATGDALTGVLALSGGGTSSSGNLTAGAYTTERGTLTVEDGAGADVSGNYDISFTGDAFEVTKKPLVHDVEVGGKTYDGTTEAPHTGDLTNVIDPDEVTLHAALCFADASAQTGVAADACEWYIDGADAGNYELPAFIPQTADIAKAPQEIVFTPAGKVSREEGSYALAGTASASSGLPVQFRIDNPEPDPAATLDSDGSTLILHHSGSVCVTAYVEPDPAGNCADATPVTRCILIASSNAEIDGLEVEGATDAPEGDPAYTPDDDRPHYVADTPLDPDSPNSPPPVVITVTPDDPNAKVVDENGNEYPDGKITVETDRAGEQEITFTVVAEDGTTKDYTVIVEQRLCYECYVVYEWNNTVFLSMRKLENERYFVSRSTWHERETSGSPETLLGESTDRRSGFSYSKGPSRSDVFTAGALHRFELIQPDGAIIRSTVQPFVPVVRGVLRAYPNPAAQGETFTLEADMPETWLQGATVKVYTTTGSLLQEHPLDGKYTKMQMSSPGVYILKVKEKETKVVIN